MIKVTVCSLAGALIGGLLLFTVAQIGESPVVYYPVHEPGKIGFNDAINYARLVSRFAVIMGSCSGAIVGAIAGAARNGSTRQAG